LTAVEEMDIHVGKGNNKMHGTCSRNVGKNTWFATPPGKHYYEIGVVTNIN
jgi:hypothetical protein